MLVLFYQACKRVSQFFISYKVNLHASYQDGAVYPYGNVVSVVSYPNHHFLAAFKNSTFNQQWADLYCVKSAVFCRDSLLAHVSDVQIIHLIVQEHAKGYLISRFMAGIINITCVKYSRKYVLYAIRYFEYPVC